MSSPGHISHSTLLSCMSIVSNPRVIWCIREWYNDVSCPQVCMEVRLSELQHSIERFISDRSTTHSRPNIPLESLSVWSQIFSCFFIKRIRGVWFEEQELCVHPQSVRSQAQTQMQTLSPLISPFPCPLKYPNLPPAPPPPKARKREYIPLTCNPITIACKFKTGFQSSRKIFKQIFPSTSIFGW